MKECFTNSILIYTKIAQHPADVCRGIAKQSEKEVLCADMLMSKALDFF